MTVSPTMDLTEILEALRIDAATWRREAKALADAGFPAPIFPVPARPNSRAKRWSRRAVTAWIDRQVSREWQTAANAAQPAENAAQAARRLALANRTLLIANSNGHDLA